MKQFREYLENAFRENRVVDQEMMKQVCLAAINEGLPTQNLNVETWCAELEDYSYEREIRCGVARFIVLYTGNVASKEFKDFDASGTAVVDVVFEHHGQKLLFAIQTVEVHPKCFIEN